MGRPERVVTSGDSRSKADFSTVALMLRLHFLRPCWDALLSFWCVPGLQPGDLARGMDARETHNQLVG